MMHLSQVNGQTKFIPRALEAQYNTIRVWRDKPLRQGFPVSVTQEAEKHKKLYAGLRRVP